jgi:hypothetical protein
MRQEFKGIQQMNIWSLPRQTGGLSRLRTASTETVLPAACILAAAGLVAYMLGVVFSGSLPGSH